MQSVLVTGGAGYIGSHAAKALQGAGFRPVVLDSLVTGNRWAVQWGPLVEGDIADRALVEATIREYGIVAVMHFAAFAYVGESMTKPEFYYHNNVVKTLALLDAVRATGVDRIVFSSTCATYGMPETLPITETTPQNPVNTYGETKLAIERALYWYGQAHGIRSVSLRYFNAAGADEGGTIGEAHEPETHLIPLILDAASGRRSHIDILGTDWPTRDGTCLRDYIHVTDLANAHVRALEYLGEGGPSTALNLGTGEAHSVREVIDEVERVTGAPVVRRDCPRRAGDPAVLVADPSLAARTLGWRATGSDLSTIIRTAWAWHQKSPSRRAGA
jgi:UDP-glucose-4-epimerase GalE